MVRVTAEKTLGRVGRYVVVFFAMAHMLVNKKNGFLAENILEF